MKEQLKKIIEESESRHFNIPDQAYGSSEKHNKVSLKLANDIIGAIDNSDDLFEGFYKAKAYLRNYLTD